MGAGNHKTPLNNFQLGFANRIGRRLAEIKAANKAATPTGTSLIVLKDQLVTAEFAAAAIKLKAHTQAKVKLVPTHFAAGSEAAGKINLNNPIEHTRQENSQLKNQLKLA